MGLVMQGKNAMHMGMRGQARLRLATTVCPLLCALLLGACGTTGVSPQKGQTAWERDLQARGSGKVLLVQV